MPGIRKIARPISLTTPAKELPTPLIGKLTANRVKQSVTKGLLVGFAVRATHDARAGKRLTAAQSAVFAFLERRNLTGKLLRRFEEVSKTTRDAFLHDFANVDAAKLDKALIDRFAAVSTAVHGEMQSAMVAKRAYRMPTALGTTHLSQSSLAALLAARLDAGAGAPPQDVFDFTLTYRGITTHDASDRAGGVEPYLVSSFYRIPNDGSGMQPLTEPFVIKQRPWGLGDMDSDEWMPSGGHQDSLGNPSNPRRIFTGIFPPLGVDTLYYSIIKVMEEDGGQGAEIARAMGDSLMTIGGSILLAGLASANPAVVLAGVLVAALGLISELVSFCFASNDDPVGDVLMAFDASTICSGATTEWAERVTGDGNDWTLYFGVASAKR